MDEFAFELGCSSKNREHHPPCRRRRIGPWFMEPLGWNHISISLTGDYHWSEANIPIDGFRPLNIVDEAA